MSMFSLQANSRPISLRIVRSSRFVPDAADGHLVAQPGMAVGKRMRRQIVGRQRGCFGWAGGSDVASV